MESLCSISNEDLNDLDQNKTLKDIRNQSGFENFTDDEIASIYEDLKAFSALCFSGFERSKRNNY